MIDRVERLEAVDRSQRLLAIVDRREHGAEEEHQAEVADAATTARLRHEQGVVALGGGALAQRALLLLEGREGAGLGDLLRVERLLGGDLALDERADRLPQGDQLLG